ncbi:MAG: DNA translocase FtsK [Gammaproteobacteria bacterium]|nr:DNA translocase FtsK [Gammaproteobacteria bacterium]
MAARRKPGRAGGKAPAGRGRKRAREEGAFLSSSQKSDILALSLVVLALFLLLALFPVSVLGARAQAWFPSGNAIGLLGARFREAATGALGAAAFALPVLLTLGGLRAGAWTATRTTVRAAILTAGLAVVASCVASLLGSAGGAGWLGSTLAGGLSSVIGWLGTTLLLAGFLIGLLVATLDWNPLRWLGRALRSAWAAIDLRGRVARLPRPWPRKNGDDRGKAARRGTERGIPEDVAEVLDGVVEELGDGAAAPDPAGHALPELPQAPDTGSAGTGTEGPASAEAAGEQALEEPTEGALPSIDLLDAPEPKDPFRMELKLSQLGEVLVEKLRSFGVQSRIGGRTTGPVVTQFEVVPAPGVKVNRIANLEADLALAMKARSIRIVAPIPGKGAVGVEIPNPEPEIVYLRDILESPAFRSSKAALPLALGKDLTGRPYVSDLARMPHVLIAGATGSGKSVCLNAFITSLVYSHSPESLRLLMVDPKMVELSVYADLPHLRHPVVTDPSDAASVLKWAVMEMERRYALLSANQARSLGEFNRMVRDGKPLRHPPRPPAPGEEPGEEAWDEGILPFVVVIVDELADLMMTVQGEVERPLTMLAQKARAIGIHLMVATQRPSVNVITGLIKANFPCRIAFRVASKTDSRTILDQNGADALLGNGDMLFLPPGQSEPVRIQGAYVPGSDTNRLTGWFRQLVRHWEDAGEMPDFAGEEDILAVVRNREGEGDAEEEDGPVERDDLFFAAAEVCVRQNQGSTSLLQRKLRIGYGRAARVVDQLHEAGVLGPPDGSKPREVLMGLDEIEALR